MIKRIVTVSTRGLHLKLQDRSICFRLKQEEIGRAHLDDLGVLIIDSRCVSISSAVLDAYMESNVAVLICGADHHPSGLLLPMAGHNLHTQRLRNQMEATKPTHKRLWQQIIQAKIRGQAATLPKGHAMRLFLDNLATQVHSGDPENMEGQASRRYWPALFEDKGFIRDRDGDAPNTFLNYGYMVLRATVARCICGAGLHPAIGLHHHHRANPFCLADDLMEPFRPWVDAEVVLLWKEGYRDMTKDIKLRLLKVLEHQVYVRDGRGPLMVGVQKTVDSLCRCFAGESRSLDLPRP